MEQAGKRKIAKVFGTQTRARTEMPCGTGV